MKFTVTELNFKATKAYFEDGYICIVLTDQKKISFPITLNKKLSNAKSEQLNNIEIICNGTGLHWPDLDEDLSLIGILEGRY